MNKLIEPIHVYSICGSFVQPKLRLDASIVITTYLLLTQAAEIWEEIAIATENTAEQLKIWTGIVGILEKVG